MKLVSHHPKLWTLIKQEIRYRVKKTLEVELQHLTDVHVLLSSTNKLKDSDVNRSVQQLQTELKNSEQYTTNLLLK